MIFTNNHARLILAGKKTRVSIPSAKATTRSVLDSGQVIRAPKFKRGQTLPVRTRGEREDEWTGQRKVVYLTRCTVRITEVLLSDLATIRYQDAVCEGYQTRLELAEAWHEKHGHHPLLVLEDGTEVGVPTPVVVLLFELANDVAEFLAPATGYTPASSRSVDTVEELDLDGHPRELPVEVVTDRSYLDKWAAEALAKKQAKDDEAKAKWRRVKRFGKDAA